MEIRTATANDAEDLLKIYSYYVEKTAISFEYVTPTIDEFKSRIQKTLEKYPYLVALEDDTIVGYAYAGVFKDRAAYDHCVETTIYIDKEYKGRGIGKALYHELQNELHKRGFSNLYACIAVCDTEDQYLTNDSWKFHEHMGFKLVGRFHECGKKFDKTYDMIWMEKIK